jgi:hypothetical protein
MRGNSKWVLIALAILGLVFGALGAGSLAARPTEPTTAGAPAAKAGRTLTNPVVISSFKNDTSPPLRDMKPVPPAPGLDRVFEVERDKSGADFRPQAPDPVVQNAFGPLAMPTPNRNFEGISNQWSVYPPDTNGDVGPNHYVQTVNLGFRVWDKSGNPLTPVQNLNTLWQGFGGVCETSNDGDPIVLYDPLADRWMISQFGLPGFPNGPSYQCIAVSQTADPAGAWHRYGYVSSATLIEDYPHFGVWPDAYYMTTNEFVGGSLNWSGVGAFAFERAAMLAGLPADMQYFHLGATQWGGMLPADLDGTTPPPAGAPNTFVEVDDSAWDPPNIPTDQIEFWQFHVDWNTPANSTFTNSANVAVAPFDGIVCPLFDRNCIPQQGTAVRLDAISDRTMWRNAYRNFGTHETLVFNHTVDASGQDNGRAGVRWYEIRSPRAAAPTIAQQSTYAPDTNSRWMASAAQDRDGNLAIGFSISSATMYPSISYAGRLATDPPNQLTQGEALMFAGTGSQTGTANRWGDYSGLVVDPTDDCTFWYTNEYYQTTSSVGWRTRIASFKFPSCGQGAVTPTVTPPPPTVTPGGPPTATPCPIQFTDVQQNNPFYANIRCLACRGIVSGYADGTFRWGNNVTRGQTSKIVSNAANFQNSIPSTQQTFSDVPYTNPFWIFIERVADQNIIAGYACGGPGEPCDPQNRPYFRPNADVTRGQISKIVSEGAGYSDPVPSTQQTFADVPSTNPFWIFIERVASRQIISGYTCGGVGEPCDPQNRAYFRWGATATRGQSSKIVAQAFYPNCVTPNR